MKKEVEQKGGSKKNISTWGGQSPENNNKDIVKMEKNKKPITKWD
jgi:hypothetical protein